MPNMQKLIEHFGTQTKLAEALNHRFDISISTSHIYYWMNKQIPIKRAKQIEILTNGQFNLMYLRPDLFR